MRSFRLYVGHRGRLTTAGRGVAVLSVATTAALGLAGGSSTVLRFGPAGPVIYAWCVAGSGLLVWSVASRLCPLWGVPLVDREGHESTGTVGSTDERGRRPFQFTLGRLLSVVALIAVLCALARLDIDTLGRLIYLTSMLTVISLGTTIAVARRHPTRLRDGVIRGGFAGSCLAAICLGWMFVLFWFIKPSIEPLLGLGVVTVSGGLLGMLIGLGLTFWQGRHRCGQRRVFTPRTGEMA